MSDPQIDKLITPARDRPFIEWKWISDIEKGFENQKNPSGQTNRCDTFKHEWQWCADGLNYERAKAECRLELEDFLECLQNNKTQARQKAILQQRAKLIKEGKYKAPPFPES